MFKRFDIVEKVAHGLWLLGKGLLIWLLMAVLCIFILVSILVIKFYYDETADFYKKFKTYQYAVVQLLPMISSEQKPILKFRKQDGGGIYHYVLAYQLNASQIQHVEMFFDNMKNRSRPKAGHIPCISKTHDTKWLFPQISRHYIHLPDDYGNEFGSFLVYGSDHKIDRVEQVCKEDIFQIINLKTNKFEQVQIALNKSSQILIFNVVEQRSRH